MKSILSRVLHDREGLVLAGITVILLIALAILLGSRFYSVTNFQSMALQVSSFGFLALAMGLSMLTGGIDLSIVSTAALASISGALVLSGKVLPLEGTSEGTLLLLAVAVTIATGLICGLVNGLLIAKLSVPPILATLGTMIFYSGVGLAITNGQSVPVIVQTLSAYGELTVAGIPLLFLGVAVTYVIVAFVLNKRRFGRKVYLLGESMISLRFSGIRSERVTIAVYTIVGGLVGCAALVMLATLNSARVGFGESYLLQSILVVVLAGFNPYGGVGRVSSLAIAVLLLQALQSAFSIFQFSPFAKDLVWGGMLLLVMIVNFAVRHQWNRRPAGASTDQPASGATETLATVEGALR